MDGAVQAISRRVLVVDDDRDSAMVLALLLESDGHAVRTASDGRAALEAAAEFRPDCAVVDLRLGEMSGYELASALRERAAERLVLLALSGLDGDEVRQQCRAAGFDAHLVKPIRDYARFRALVSSLELHEDLRLV